MFFDVGFCSSFNIHIVLEIWAWTFGGDILFKLYNFEEMEMFMVLIESNDLGKKY